MGKAEGMFSRLLQSRKSSSGNDSSERQIEVQRPVYHTVLRRLESGDIQAQREKTQRG
jgi:hypothetical protein